MQIRHGDVFLRKLDSAPKGKFVPAKGDVVLAYGEVTGHRHAIDASYAVNMLDQEVKTGATPSIFEVADTAVLDHEEHGPVTLPAGFYQVIHQREYEPEIGQRAVAD